MRLQLLCSSLQSLRSLPLSFGGDSLLPKLKNCCPVTAAVTGDHCEVSLGRLLGRQTLYCLSRPSVNAGAMLVLMPQLDGADPKLLSCETPTHLNVDAEKVDLLMNTILCI